MTEKTANSASGSLHRPVRRFFVFHAAHARWLWNDEAIFLIGFAGGRVSYEPEAKWLYSARLFLGVFKIELLWRTGEVLPRP